MLEGLATHETEGLETEPEVELLQGTEMRLLAIEGDDRLEDRDAIDGMLEGLEPRA